MKIWFLIFVAPSSAASLSCFLFLSHSIPCLVFILKNPKLKRLSTREDTSWTSKEQHTVPPQNRSNKPCSFCLHNPTCCYYRKVTTLPLKLLLSAFQSLPLFHQCDLGSPWSTLVSLLPLFFSFLLFFFFVSVMNVSLFCFSGSFLFSCWFSLSILRGYLSGKLHDVGSVRYWIKAKHG